MTVQVIQRSGGRRFGPTALAAQARPVVIPPPARPADLRRGLGVPGDRGVPGIAAPRRSAAVPVRGRAGRAYTRPPAGLAERGRSVVGSRCQDGSTEATYRMGRWARLAMTLVVTAAVVVGTLTVLLRPGSAPTRFVTVQPGDTLASIAVSDMPGWDPAAAVARIESLNGLDGAEVPVGTVLRIPTTG